MACRSSFLWSRLAEDRIVLSDVSWQFGLSLFILGRFFLLGMGLGLCIKWVRVAEFFDPTIAPQNPAVRLLGRRWGFWCPRVFAMACQVLSSISARAFSLVQGTFLALRYTKRVLIKFWQPCAPHVRRCDSNPTVGTSLAFMGRKTHMFILIWGINTHLNGYFNLRYKYPFKPICLFTFTLKSSCTHILSPVKSSSKLTSLFSIKSLSKEFFLISVSFLLSLTHIFSLLSFFSSHFILSFVPPWVF